MDRIEIYEFLDRVKEEIRIFESPSANSSKKMLEIIESALANTGKIKLDNFLKSGNCRNTGNKCPSGGNLPNSGECYFCKHYL